MPTVTSTTATSKWNSTTTRGSAKDANSARKARHLAKRISAAKWLAVKSDVETAIVFKLGVVCVDLDGVLLYHESEWEDSRLGPPLDLGRKLVQLLVGKGYRVVVLTSRKVDGIQATAKLRILNHLIALNFPVSDVTNVKPTADAYFDDKAYRIPRNWE